MRIIHWNIKCGSNTDKKAEYIKEMLSDSDTIVCLQEVTPEAKETILSALGGMVNYAYSLNYRAPGLYDGMNRKLGVLLICPKTMYIIDSGVISRSPLPDRTLFAEVLYYGEIYRILSLHSITGCAYSKAKSTQFFSFAEAVEKFHPDIITTDANEPATDHYDISHIQFYDNHDKGLGARTFFMAMKESGLEDAYAHFYNPRDFEPGKCLTTSIKVKGKGNCRYDFIFVNTERLPLKDCKYLYDKGLELGSDHAIVTTEVELKRQASRPDEGINPNCFLPYNPLTEEYLLKFCLHYKGQNQKETSLMAGYEKHWIEDILHDPGKGIDYVTPNDLHILETFNVGDGVPIGIKAILFNRWCHWSSYSDINQFKEWYLTKYLGNG